ncbi:MAG: 3-phosphoshikimate 1-carboxyvinyltransferase [bacterium]
MTVEIFPSHTAEWDVLLQIVDLPPDKSIFHRLLIIGSLTESKITIPISSIEEIPSDVYATILALESLGVPIEIERSKIILQGVGTKGFHAPKHKINCGNSGTTARLMMGLLAGQEFDSILIGDASLSQRPMKRLADLMNDGLGARIETSANGAMPVTIHGQKIHGGSITLPVASAQMKSAILLAGLFADSEVSVAEPSQSRDHTERMLSAFGKGFTSQSLTNKIAEYEFTTPEEFTYTVPGDFSSAAFLIGAGIMVGRDIRLMNVGLNPTRSVILDILGLSGLDLKIWNAEPGPWNEPVGNIDVLSRNTFPEKSFEFASEASALIIDEIPILSVLAPFCKGDTIFSNISELRKKESDRIHAITSNLLGFGILVEESADGFTVSGVPGFNPLGDGFDHYGDHRIAMAFSVMALRSEVPVTISEAEIVSVSYPNFYRDLGLIAGKDSIRIS